MGKYRYGLFPGHYKPTTAESLAAEAYDLVAGIDALVTAKHAFYVRSCADDIVAGFEFLPEFGINLRHHDTDALIDAAKALYEATDNLVNACRDELVNIAEACLAAKETAHGSH